MADIELIVKMPEEKYNKFMYSDDVDEEELVETFEYLMNGTPIPDNATNGEWVDQYDDGNWHCSKCGAIVEKDEQINHNWYFCYHCGTKMNAPYQKGGKE